MARRRAVGGRTRRLPLTDTARAYVATGATAVLGGALFAAAGFTGFAGGPYLTAEDRLSVQALTGLAYLFLWPVYCFAYAVLVWRAYRRLDPVTLRVTARRDLREGRRLVNRVFGEGGAVSSATTVSAAAVIVTVLVAQSGLLDRSPALIVLAFLTVAGSWVVMLVTFSLAYLRLNEASKAAEGLHLELASPHPYRFDDYVTVALLASTMAATISVAPKTREGWRLLRANVAVAFAFNSVVIAMVVSLLIGGLGV